MAELLDVLRLVAAAAQESGGSGALHLEDRFRSTDVSDGGATVVCVHTLKSTNFSREVFSASDDVDVSVRVRLNGGTTAIGIVGKDTEGACSQYVVGEREIRGSVGCVINHDGAVCVVCDDTIHFRGSCDTRDPTVMRMTLKGGKLSFTIDGHGLDCDWLASGRIAPGEYRFGVSVPTNGARATITAASSSGASITQSSGRITLADCCRSVLVSDGGRTLTCRSTRHATNYSEESFALATCDITVTLRVERRCGGYVFVGILPSSATNEAPNFFVGEKEIGTSISCGIRDGEVVLMKADKFIFTGDCDTRDPTVMRMTISRGSLRFAIDGKTLRSAELDSMTLNGSVRVGVSLGTEGQRATLQTTPTRFVL